jgi:hypothetical protein
VLWEEYWLLARCYGREYCLLARCYGREPSGALRAEGTVQWWEVRQYLTTSQGEEFCVWGVGMVRVLDVVASRSRTPAAVLVRWRGVRVHFGGTR